MNFNLSIFIHLSMIFQMLLFVMSELVDYLQSRMIFISIFISLEIQSIEDDADIFK